MFPKLGICLLACEFVACGGTITNNTGDSNGAGGSSVNVGGAAVANTGGKSGVGGSGGTNNCPSTTVNFQVIPALNSPTQWCLGMPGNCGGQTMTILDASGALGLSSYCQFACETCTMNLCPPIACLLPVAPVSYTHLTL